MEELLNRIENLFGLSDNRKFQNQKGILLSDKANEKKQKKSKKIILEIIKDEIENDELISSKLSKSDKSEIKRDIAVAIVGGTYDDEDYEALLDSISQKVGVVVADADAFDIISDIIYSAQKFGDDATADLLGMVEEDAALSEKKEKISGGLDKLLEFINAKFKNICDEKEVSDDIKNEFEDLCSKLSEVNNEISLAEPQNLYSLRVDMQEAIKELYDFVKVQAKGTKEALKGKMDDLDEKEPEKKKGGVLSLIRAPKGGKSDRSLKDLANAGFKIIVAGGIIVGIIFAGTNIYSFFAKRGDKDIDLEPAKPGQSIESIADSSSEPGSIFESSEEELINLISATASNVYDNWVKVGCDYTKDDIVELIRCLNGLESNISIGVADNMIIEMINAATISPVNNIIAGETVQPGYPLVMSELLISDQKGIKALNNMESYINSSISDYENIEKHAEKALKEEIELAIQKETVGGLTLETCDPAVRLLWARLAIGLNSITGTLGEEFNITVGYDTYSQSDINNSDIFEQIAKDAKAEFGEMAKTTVK